jgi:eukaryotic-like serine/threonine-protein kinase
MSISVAPAPLQLSKYKLLEELGHGGMATVYRARDTRLDRDVALKLIHRHLRQSEEMERRFDGEARAIAKLRHPNIVEVYDVSSDDDDERYLIVELIRGITLRELMKQQGPLPVEFAAQVVLELAAALEHAHAEGVIHRDIKPENVLLEMPTAGSRGSVDDWERPRVKLTDFGIAKLLDAQGVTSTGQVLGSPAHMAPEQIEGKAVDARADIFSLGVLFYEAAVGSLPFSGNNPAQVLRSVLDGTFEPADRVNPQLGSRWTAIMNRALAREPDQRFASVEEFGAAVRAELTETGYQDVRRGITNCLVDIEGYKQAFAEDICAGLGSSAERAREAKDLPLATEQLCRALAYKPGDAELLRRVASLRRRTRTRQYARYGALSLGALLGLGVLYQAVPRDSWEPTPPPRPVAMPPREPEIPVTPLVTSVPSPPIEKQRAPVVKPPRVRRVARPAGGPSTADPAEGNSRLVSVSVTGAVGGTVKIDGKERPWFGGVTHELAVGPHLFEFVPPNEDCCTPTSQTVVIEPGESVLAVVGRIPFKAAGIGVTHPDSQGWLLSCPTLFAGSLPLPGRRSVHMSRVEADGTCTLSSSEEGAVTRSKEVVLQAGNTTLLPWP